MDRYDDIIHLPHHVSSVHPPMSRQDRAAQFAPFAALTGHGAAIQETARLTEERAELDEDEKRTLDMRLQYLRGQLISGQTDTGEIRVTYFVPDTRKSGGRYETVSGRIRKLDSGRHTIQMADGTRIPIEEIAALDGELFCSFE